LFNVLVIEGRVDPCLSRTFKYDELPEAHQLMYENRHPHGNMSILVGAVELGTGVTADVPVVGAVKPPAREAAEIYARPHAEPDPNVVVADDRPVRELMHHGVLTCGTEATVEQIATLLLDHKIHAVVVVDEASHAAGVVSQTDLVLARQGRTPDVFRSMKASEIMTSSLVSCGLETPISEAVTTMTRLRIHRLVVLDRTDGRGIPVGVVSMTDIVRSMMGVDPDQAPYEDPA
jgi:crotonyl-CoA carboxylase/reductase